MKDTMLAVYLTGPRRLELREVPVPRPAAGRMLVRVRAVGVCGSDVHYYQHGRMGPFVPAGPLVLGHESSGEVVECGPGVKGFAPGDRVALEPGIPCGSCDACRRGRYNLCPDVYFMGSAPDQHGAFREYVDWVPRCAHPVPQGVSDEEAALIEPLAAAVYAARLSGVRPGDRALVFGCGPIGLLIARMCRISGAAEVLMVERDPARLMAAVERGERVLPFGETPDHAAALRAALLPRGADVVFEAAGSPDCHRVALSCAARGATVVYVGWLPEAELPLDMHAIGTKELVVRGMLRYSNVYPESLALVAAGLVDLKGLVSDRYPLDRVQEALEAALERKPGVLKLLITMA